MRALAGGLLAVLVLVTTAPVEAAAPAPVTGRLLLRDQTTWVQPTSTFRLQLGLVGPSPRQLQVTVAFHAAVTSRGQYQRTLLPVHPVLGRSLGTPSRVLFGALERDPSGRTLTASIQGPELGITTTGVYPLEISLRDRRRPARRLDRIVTHVVVLPFRAPGARLGVALTLALHAAVASRPGGRPRLGSTTGLAALTGALASRLYPPVPLTLVPTPETLEALAASRHKADRSLIAALRSALRGRQVIGAPYVRVDPAALAASGLTPELQAQLDAGAETIGRLLGVAPDRRTWVADSRLRGIGLKALPARIDRAAVPEVGLEPADLRLTVTQPFSLEAPGASKRAVSDPGLGDYFQNSGDQVLAAHRLLADLAVLWQDRPHDQTARGVAVLPPASWRPNRPFLDQLMVGLASSPVLAGTTLDGLFSTVQPLTTSRSRPLVRHLQPGEGAVSALPGGPVRAARAALEGLDSTMPGRGESVSRLSRQVLLAQADGLRASRRLAYLAAVDRAVDRQQDQVELPRPRTVTLTAREGEVPFTFFNHSDAPIDVVVKVESARLGFPGPVEQRQRLLPRNTTVHFPVRARSSGTFPLTVNVVSPEGALTFGTTHFNVRSTAASGTGVMLSAGAAAFLLLWWGHHLVRGRRARRLVPA